MNKLVTIRSNRYGLDIEFDSETEFDQLLEVLGQKFKQSGRFFKDAQMALSFSGRELTRAEEDRVLAVIRENTQIEILCIIEPNGRSAGRRSRRSAVLKRLRQGMMPYSFHVLTGAVPLNGTRIFIQR